MVLDIIAVLIVAFGFYLGYNRGLIRTAFDTLSLIVAILVALRVAPYIIKYVDQLLTVAPAISYLVGLVITFILALGLIRFVGKQLEKLLEAINLDFVNKLAGGLLQGAFFAFLLSMVLWLLGNYGILNEEIKKQSQTYQYLEPLPEYGRNIFTRLEPIFKDFWAITKESLEHAKDRVGEGN